MNSQNGNDTKSNLSTTIEDGSYNKPSFCNFNLLSLEQNSHNKMVFQKYFIYQLKKNILNAKKISLFNDSNLNKNQDENNSSAVSFDYYSNIFNVNYSKIQTGAIVKFLNFQNTIIVNDYIIYIDDIICKEENFNIYRGKKIYNEDVFVNFY